jgi:hypothetical protein
MISQSLITLCGYNNTHFLLFEKLNIRILPHKLSDNTPLVLDKHPSYLVEVQYKQYKIVWQEQNNHPDKIVLHDLDTIHNNSLQNNLSSISNNSQNVQYHFDHWVIFLSKVHLPLNLAHWLI